MPKINPRKHRDWCRTCEAYTYHGRQIGCLVCTDIEPAEPNSGRPRHVTIKPQTWLDSHYEIEVTYDEDGGPVRIDGLLVPKSRLLHTLHSFRPCFVYVRGNPHFLKAADRR